MRIKLVTVFVLLLGLGTIGTITVLQERSSESRAAELDIARVGSALQRLQSDPFRSAQGVGGSPELARRLMRTDRRIITETLAELGRDAPPWALQRVWAPLRRNIRAIEQIFPISSSPSFSERPDERLSPLLKTAGRTNDAAAELLAEAARDYHRRASNAQTQATVGSAGAILLLLAAFGLLFGRSTRERASAERSEERVQTLVANIQGAVYRRAVDNDWTMQFVSDRIEEISGHPAYEFLRGKRSYASLVDPEHRAWVTREMEAADETGAFTTEYQITHADGGVRWVSEKGHVIRGSDMRILWVDGTISDVTELKRLETELRVAQRLESVGQLAAGIAHEINTPIQFVSDSVGFLDESYGDLQKLMREYRSVCATTIEGRDDAAALTAKLTAAEDAADLDYLEQRIPAALNRTEHGLRRVSTIVAAMRDFGRPQQDTHEPADLNEALRATLVVSQNEYKYVADVETELGPLPPVICNVSELNQVFLNLIVNAAHAIADSEHDKGTIRIQTACVEDDVTIAITDSGTGIPPAIRERIFDPFFTTKDVGRGTGQGLAISRSIVVDKHGGSLSVDSEVGHGTTFTLRLPLVPAASPAVA